MRDGIIAINSNKAKKFGFTSDKFTDYSYLWKKGDFIYISFIESIESGKGYLLGLFNKIQEMGFGIKVPTPSFRMSYICAKFGMDFIKEPAGLPFESDDMLEIWIKQPPSLTEGFISASVVKP